MSSQSQQLDMSDLATRLNPTDKDELRQFLHHETQRSHIQAQTHRLTKMCWKSCVTGSIRNPRLEKGEESCMANCVERFLDVNFHTMRHLEKMNK